MKMIDMLTNEANNCKNEIQECREKIALLLCERGDDRVNEIFKLVDVIIRDEVQLTQVNEQIKILGGVGLQHLDDVYTGKEGCGA